MLTSVVIDTLRGRGKGETKGIFCVFDLNDEEHRWSSKAEGFSIMLVVQGLDRKLTKE